MTYTKLVRIPKGNVLPLPKDFTHRLRLQVGRPLIIHLIEEAGVILIIPAPQPVSAKILSPRTPTRSARKRPRYDHIFDSAREIITEPIPFASAVIQSQVLQSLRAIPSLE